MASILDAFLDPDEDFSVPEKRAATAAALRKQFNYGTLGQLMGVQPTQQAGSAMQEQSQGSLKLAMAKQQDAREAASRAAERQSDLEWKQMQYDQSERQNKALNQYRTASLNKPSSSAVERFTGEVVNGMPGRRSSLTGEWTPDEPQTPGAAGAEVEKPSGFTLPPGVSPKTEAQQAAYQFATRMATAVPQVEAIFQNGYMPTSKDIALLAAAGQSPRAGVFIEKQISPEGRVYMDAAAPLVNAILRKESGAAITAEEWTRAFREWLPRPGEPPEVTANKMAKLRAEMNTMAQMTGLSQFWVEPPRAFGQEAPPQGSPPGAAPAQPRSQGDPDEEFFR